MYCDCRTSIQVLPLFWSDPLNLYTIPIIPAYFLSLLPVAFGPRLQSSVLSFGASCRLDIPLIYNLTLPSNLTRTTREFTYWSPLWGECPLFATSADTSSPSFPLHLWLFPMLLVPSLNLFNITNASLIHHITHWSLRLLPSPSPSTLQSKPLLSHPYCFSQKNDIMRCVMPDATSMALGRFPGSLPPVQLIKVHLEPLSHLL